MMSRTIESKCSLLAGDECAPLAEARAEVERLREQVPPNVQALMRLNAKYLQRAEQAESALAAAAKAMGEGSWSA